MNTPSTRARLLRRLLSGVLRLPRRVRLRLTGPPAENDRGTRLDLDTHTMIWMDQRLHPPLTKGEPGDARDRLKQSLSIVSGRPRDVGVREVDLDGVPGRLYVPGTQQAPILVYCHGGGWVVGDLDTHDPLCRRLAEVLQWQVVSVDYRLAPEHPFPAGLDDAVKALRFVQAHAAEFSADPDRVAIGGDSAGGNLAAAACLVMRDQGFPPPWLQVLIYPAVDMRCQADSHRLFAEGFLLSEADIQYYLGHYAPGDLLDPRTSPLLAEDLSGLPQAVVVTAGFDPLRDEGEAYARALAAAGVSVEHLDAMDMVHGFANMDGALGAADRELSRLEDRLRALDR